MSVRSRQSASELLERARQGERVALARLISMIESGGDGAREVGRLTYPMGGTTYSVGITGAPGGGKSTLTTQLISALRARGGDVAVLAVDPSSPFTGGAILGDRVRMQDHALDDGVFIRSMATRGHLGGLALATPEAVRVLDAVGFTWVLIETVGVGQVEVEVAGEADTTVVVVNPGWGDAVQASKAGLLEVADVFVINKADRPGLKETRRDLESMLDLGEERDGRRPPIVATVALEGEGTDEVVDAIEAHRRYLEETGELERRRQARVSEELRTILSEQMAVRVREACDGDLFESVRQQVLDRTLDPYTAAEQLLDAAGLA